MWSPADDANCGRVVVPERCEGRDAGVSASLGDSTGSSLWISYYWVLAMRSSRRQERRRSESMGVGWGSQSSLHPSIAAVLSSGPLPMERTRNVLLDVLYSHERLTRLLLSILSRGGTFHLFPWALNALTSIYLVQRRNVPLPRTLFLWYKLARFYGLSSPLTIFRLRESPCGQ